MENMDKGLTLPKWVLINQQKIPQKLSSQIVCPSPKFLDFNEKKLHWAFVVHGYMEALLYMYYELHESTICILQIILDVIENVSEFLIFKLPKLV
jgi:hypothetical protein